MSAPRDRDGVLLSVRDIVMVECKIVALRDTEQADEENDIALVTVIPCALDPHGSPFALHASQVRRVG
jgi:hypothetical protein